MTRMSLVAVLGLLAGCRHYETVIVAGKIGTLAPVPIQASYYVELKNPEPREVRPAGPPIGVVSPTNGGREMDAKVIGSRLKNGVVQLVVRVLTTGKIQVLDVSEEMAARLLAADVIRLCPVPQPFSEN